jgi:hypothetical protein
MSRNGSVTQQDLSQLEQILRRQLDGHHRLLDCIERNREAVRRADMDAIRSICEQENAVAQELAELEKARLYVVGRLTEVLRPDAAAPLSVSEISQALDKPESHRLTALAAQLRNTIQEVRRASEVVRAAADALARHMGGLMQTVQSALGRAPVYGRLGRLATGAQSQFCVDVTS